MTSRFAQFAAAAATAATLTVAGCSTDLPDEKPTQEQGNASVVGLMKSADQDGVVLQMPDGTERTFEVRPSEAEELDLVHLDSHAGFTDVAFRISYRTEDGVDYAVAAEETAPPNS